MKILLFSFLGVLLACFVIILIIRYKLKKALGPNYNTFKQTIKDLPNIAKDEYSSIKSIGGMTNMIKPKILKDFADFNVNNLFNTVEKDITKYLNAIEKKDLSLVDKDLIYLKTEIKDIIDTYNEEEIFEKFSDIDFHKHSLKNYTKSNGTATIQVASSISYYYDTNKKDEVHYSDVKKGTKYVTEYVYVYDETKFKENEVNFSLHCPNCGAPITSLSSDCAYCTIKINPINMRCWKVNKIYEIK